VEETSKSAVIDDYVMHCNLDDGNQEWEDQRGTTHQHIRAGARAAASCAVTSPGVSAARIYRLSAAVVALSSRSVSSTTQRDGCRCGAQCEYAHAAANPGAPKSAPPKMKWEYFDRASRVWSAVPPALSTVITSAYKSNQPTLKHVFR